MQDKEIAIKIDKSGTLILGIMFIIIFPGAELVSSWIVDKSHINSGILEVIIMVVYMIVVSIFFIKIDAYIPCTQELKAKFCHDHVILVKGKMKRKIYYKDIREVVKIMVINRIYSEKGRYRVKIKVKGKNYVVYSDNDEYEKHLDFEETELSKLYFEFRSRGVKCC